MLLWLRQLIRVSTACVLTLVFAVPQSLVAQVHVLSPQDLHSATIAATKTRERNIETVRNFLSSPVANKAMRSAKMEPEQVRQAVAGLSDQDLAQLAARSEKAQADFAAGSLSDRDLILILLAVAVLVLIIVAVR